MRVRKVLWTDKCVLSSTFILEGHLPSEPVMEALAELYSAQFGDANTGLYTIDVHWDFVPIPAIGWRYPL